MPHLRLAVSMALVSTTLLMAQVPAEAPAVAPAEVPAVAAKPAAPVLATLKGTCEGHDPTGKQPVRLSLWFHDYRQEGAQLVRDVRAANDGTFTLADVPWVQVAAGETKVIEFRVRPPKARK